MEVEIITKVIKVFMRTIVNKGVEPLRTIAPMMEDVTTTKEETIMVAVEMTEEIMMMTKTIKTMEIKANITMVEVIEMATTIKYMMTIKILLPG